MDRAKAVLREKFTEIKAHFKKYEKSQINNLNDHLNEFKNNNQSPESGGRRK